MSDDSLAPKQDLKNFTLTDLTAFAVNHGLPPFRGKQIFSWLYRPGITSFNEMTDLPKALRESLAGWATFSRFTSFIKEVSDDGTCKYGFHLPDDKMIESVLIPEADRNTLCISTQVGCAMGCAFCLTATMGFSRNLSCAEIINQVCAVRDDLSKDNQPGITNLVFMGMGEPLANFENLIHALTILMDERGLHFSANRITVSTCGIVPKIIELGKKFKVNLAISLHAADNKTRSSLMPINQRYPLEALMAACRELSLPRRKKITFEYALLKGINDSDNDAVKLARLLHDMQAKINLLPCNEAPEIPFAKPDEQRIASFQNILKKNGYTVLIRSSRGADISAACGQLAAKTARPFPPAQSTT